MATPTRSSVLAALAAALLSASPLAAATLDVAPDGDDLVFTWDGGVDDLLRGTTPDDLTPYQVMVSSPLRIPGENAVVGEDYYYRLASGSNMGFRVERTFPFEDTWANATLPVTLPERHAWETAFDMFETWPTLTEVTWIQRGEIISRSAAWMDGAPIGDDVPLAPTGGVFVAFSETTTVTLVGSHDPDFEGITTEDFNRFTFMTALPVPYHASWGTAFEVLCGERGVDWQDVDLDGVPDECGRDTDGDGLPDTGLWRGPLGSLVLRCFDPLDDSTPFSQVEVRGTSFGTLLFGEDFDLVPGQAFRADHIAEDTFGPPPVNSPFRIPTR